MKKTKHNSKKTLENSIPANNPMSGIFDFPGGTTTTASQPHEFANNLTYNLVSLQRIILTYAYVQYGVFRTLVDQPVNDAFKGGVRIKTDEVDEAEIESLEKRLKKIHYWRKASLALKWSRLFGGAGMIINLNEDYSKEFKIDRINDKSKLDFKVADRWELAWNGIPNEPTTTFSYYGEKIHQSRVAKIIGKEAPSLAKQRLQGWGMSEIECIIRESNSSLKHENVVFELLDEAKVDIWKIKGFNNQVLSKLGQGVTTKRIQYATMIKNFLNAITLDKEDDYEQKQMSFSGLSEILDQIRITMAAAARMPMAKLYGLSAKGFASGEDDLENYAAIVEYVRMDAIDVLDATLPAVCMQEWGFVPDDLGYEFQPARTLTADQQESVNNAKFQRHMTMYDKGFYDAQECCEALKRDKLLTIQTKVAAGAEPQPPAMSMIEDGIGDGGQGKKTSAKAPKEKEAEG